MWSIWQGKFGDELQPAPIRSGEEAAARPSIGVARPLPSPRLSLRLDCQIVREPRLTGTLTAPG
jgi:hypothetical protein